VLRRGQQAAGIHDRRCDPLGTGRVVRDRTDAGVAVPAAFAPTAAFHPPFELDDLRTAALHYARPMAQTCAWRSWLRDEPLGGRK